MDAENTEMDEIVETLQKKVLNEELLEKYNELEQRLQRDVKDFFNSKFEYESDNRIKALTTNVVKRRKTPTPKEEIYLTQVITYYFDYMNGVEKMSFEQIQNL